jgi:hypothetical protein
MVIFKPSDVIFRAHLAQADEIHSTIFEGPQSELLDLRRGAQLGRLVPISYPLCLVRDLSCRHQLYCPKVD